MRVFMHISIIIIIITFFIKKCVKESVKTIMPQRFGCFWKCNEKMETHNEIIKNRCFAHPCIVRYVLLQNIQICCECNTQFFMTLCITHFVIRYCKLFSEIIFFVLFNFFFYFLLNRSLSFNIGCSDLLLNAFSTI